MRTHFAGGQPESLGYLLRFLFACCQPLQNIEPVFVCLGFGG